ncbi:MAG: protein kinase [Victivallales bacterium]|nr:protein kinase [Victivallales bacterium]
MTSSPTPEPKMDATVVMNDLADAPSDKRSDSSSGTHPSNLIGHAPQPIDQADLTADSSLDFRRTLEQSGKRYRIQKMIGEGGFGRIFLAKDLTLGRDVVIKSLKENHLKHDKSVRMFISEARLNAQLDHPAIVPIYSLDTDSNDGLHLAMRLVNGIDLKEYLKRCREKAHTEKITSRHYERSLQVRLEYFLKVCDAIEYCHARGIIHCDLKPENIMLGQNGEVYVMDWGIACPEGTNRKGRVEGTPAYMAPETIEMGATTPQVDVFALGMILNELVTLRKAVSGADSKEIIAKIRSGEFEPSTPSIHGLKISSALQAIIEKARAVEPEERYSSVKELSSDIRHWLFQEEVSALPDTPFQKVMRFLFHHRYATALILVGTLCVSAMLALYGAHRQQCVASHVTNEMMRRLKVQIDTEALASDIDNKLLRIREQLKGLTTSQLIEQNAPEQYTDQSRFYLSEEFAPDSPNPPPNLLETPFYCQKISFQDAAYFKPDDMPREALLPFVRHLRSSRRQGLTILSDSMDDAEDIRDFTSEAMFQRFCEKGALVRHITYVLENGVAMRYPGMYEKVASPNEFLRHWLQEKMASGIQNILWSPPYADSSEHSVIACWLPLRTVQGKDIGVVGFELCYHKMLQPIIQKVQEEQFKTSYYLLDKEGHQIFTSDMPDFMKCVKHICQNTLDTIPDFPYPEWLPRVKENVMPQFIGRLHNGQLVRVSIAKIPQADWTLVRVVPPGTVDRIDQELVHRNRQDIEQEIFLEKELFSW